MNLADKPCYPTYRIMTNSLGMPMIESVKDGLTFRERLIIALASNPGLCRYDSETYVENASIIILQADAIIKQLEGSV